MKTETYEIDHQSAGRRSVSKLKVAIASIAVMVCALVGTVTAVQPANAAASPTAAFSSSPDQSDKAAAKLPIGEPAGIKSAIVKALLKQMAGMIRSGANTFIDLGSKFLDDAAEKALRNHSSEIADVLDDVANFPDIATHQIRSQVYNGLKASLGDGTAQVIASAVEGVLWILL